jgi:hypothetical protein
MNSAQDEVFEKAQPVAGTGTDINQNSEVYSKYIRTKTDIGDNLWTRPAWKQSPFGNKQQDDNQVQNQS